MANCIFPNGMSMQPQIQTDANHGWFRSFQLSGCFGFHWSFTQSICTTLYCIVQWTHSCLRYGDDHDIWLSLYWYVSCAFSIDVIVRTRPSNTYMCVCMCVFAHECVGVCCDCVRSGIKYGWCVFIYSPFKFVHNQNSIPNESISFFYFIFHTLQFVLLFGFLLCYEKSVPFPLFRFDLSFSLVFCFYYSCRSSAFFYNKSRQTKNKKKKIKNKKQQQESKVLRFIWKTYFICELTIKHRK